MAKNILIFFPHQLRRNFGGAYTFLYHLRTAFRSPEVQLHFLPDLIRLPEEVETAVKPPSVLKQIVKSLLPKKAAASIRVLRYLKEKQHEPFLEQLKTIDFSLYEAIHFHETIDLWRSHHLLKNFRGKIILTSHSPKPYHQELLEDVFKLKRKDISSTAYQKLEYIDNFAFSCAHLLVAPCREAANSYKKIWPMFQTLTWGKNWKFIPTGIEEAPVTKMPASIRRELGIHDNAFVVVFNGRHSAVKGFDLLTVAATQLLAENDQLYFLITGVGENQPAVSHERWIVTGWTTAPQDYVNAGDLVIVPNRQTYFDLNVLLALSLGKPVLLSETGGNNYFHRFETKGISFLPALSADSIVRAITAAYKKRAQLAGSSFELRKIFLEQFTLDRFAEHYGQFYLSV